MCKINYKAISVVLCSLLIVLAACNNQAERKQQKQYATYTVTAKSLKNDLYFSGTLKPLHVFNVPTPADGFIAQKNFKYGQTIAKGKSLIKLNSNKLINDYNQALANYLTAKDKFMRSQAKIKGSKKLLGMGIISRDEFEQDKSSVNTDHLSFLQSLYNLENTSTTDEVSFKDIKKLSLTDISKIEQAIKLRYNYLNVVAPHDGVALLPAQSGKENQDAAVNVGDQVKLGQVIVTIGDLSGVSVDISIPEINIDKVKRGDAVTITGVAFPNQELQGYIKSIDSQAAKNESAGLPTFPAVIAVPRLTQQQKDLIRVGMSAKIKVHLQTDNILAVPIDAIIEKQGKNFVKKIVAGKIEETPVQIGASNIDKVIIKSGLHAGDKIIYSLGKQGVSS